MADARHSAAAASYQFFGTSRRFNRIHHDLFTAPAFQLLPATARLILLDFVTLWDHHTDYGTSPSKVKSSIPYSHALCRVLCSRSQFKRSLEAIAAHGFIYLDPQSHKLSTYRRAWFPSKEWTQFKPNLEQLSRLTVHQKRRLAASGSDAQIALDPTLAAPLPAPLEEGETIGTARPVSAVGSILQRVWSLGR